MHGERGRSESLLQCRASFKSANKDTKLMLLVQM